MILLVSGNTVQVRRASAHVGILHVPSGGHDPSSCQGRVWAADNGAFSGFDEPAFVRMLRRLREGMVSGVVPRPLFVAAPDAVGDASETSRLFSRWEPLLHADGWPVALVAQDGLRAADIPWSSLEAVFIGGTTGYKLGRDAAVIAETARASGKWVHMGRVNTVRRMRRAHAIGCGSVDGSSFSRWPSTLLFADAACAELSRTGRLF